jgi:hypothetical protein
LNRTDASHIQALLAWLTDPHAVAPELADAARDSAAVLAAAAHCRLGAGLTSGQVTAAWPDLLTSCAGCPTCLPAQCPNCLRPIDQCDGSDPLCDEADGFGSGRGDADDADDADQDDEQSDATRGVLVGGLS